MTIWTPRQAIVVKVIGLAWRGRQLLAGEVEDSAGIVKGARPLGGCVEFGESRESALAREFTEELGCAITIAGPWVPLENIYEHEGALGHEYVFAANVVLADRSLYERKTISFAEADLTDCRAGWFDPRDLPSGIELYPAGLGKIIADGVIEPL